MGLKLGFWFLVCIAVVGPSRGYAVRSCPAGTDPVIPGGAKDVRYYGPTSGGFLVCSSDPRQGCSIFGTAQYPLNGLQIAFTACATLREDARRNRNAALFAFENYCKLMLSGGTGVYSTIGGYILPDAPTITGSCGAFSYSPDFGERQQAVCCVPKGLIDPTVPPPPSADIYQRPR